MGGSNSLSGKRYPTNNIRYLLSALFIAVALLQSSNVFVASAASGYTFGNNRPLDQASVSVVRLVVTYTAAATPGCPSTATGLGVLVGSWPTTAGSTNFTNWVMTDGFLVDPQGVSCGTGKPTEALSALQIYVNDAYTSGSGNITSTLLKALTCTPTDCTDGTTSTPITCQVSATCSGGVVLVPFQTTAPQPYIDVASTDQTTPGPFGIGLASLTLRTITPTAAQADQFLTPVSVANTTDTTDPKNESGMPIVNDVGQLLDMNTKAVDTGGSIRSYMSSQLLPGQPGHSNSLRDSWNQGILDFYKPDYANAVTDFKNAGTQNKFFGASVAFWSLTMTKVGNGGTVTSGGSTKTPVTGTTPTTGVNFFGHSISDSLFTTLVVVALVLLIIILAIFTFPVVRRKAQQLKEAKEFAELVRKAEADAAQIAQKEKEERLRKQQGWNAPQSMKPGNAAPPVQAQPAPMPNLRCPNCGTSVNRADKFCNNCHSPISLSNSGWHVRLNKPTISASVPVPHTNPVVNVAQETSIPPHANPPGPLCPRCQQPIPANAVFCASCGYSLSPAVALQTQGMLMPASNMSSFSSPALAASQPPHEPVREQMQDGRQNNKQQEEKVSVHLGQRLGNYQIISLLGEGGFAEVYLGEHIHLGSQAAIKVLHGQLARDERERFLAEARTLVRLVHPHIVRVLDFGIEDKTPFLVMDVAIDGTLRQRHPRGTRLSRATVNS